MNEIDTALYSALSGSTGLTSLLANTTSIYHVRAPNVSALPYVVFSVQGGGDENICPTDLINIVYFIRAYSATSATNASAIHKQIRAALHKKSLTVTGYTHLQTKLEQELESSEEQPSNAPIYMCGGLYRIRLDS